MNKDDEKKWNENVLVQKCWAWTQGIWSACWHICFSLAVDKFQPQFSIAADKFQPQFITLPENMRPFCPYA